MSIFIQISGRMSFVLRLGTIVNSSSVSNKADLKPETRNWKLETTTMPFKSFFMGGFECSTHRDARGRRLDLIASTRHDEFAEADYTRLLDRNIRTCRDGLRWHLIEKEPFRYDFSSLESQV